MDLRTLWREACLVLADPSTGAGDVDRTVGDLRRMSQTLAGAATAARRRWEAAAEDVITSSPALCETVDGVRVRCGGVVDLALRCARRCRDVGAASRSSCERLGAEKRAHRRRAVAAAAENARSALSSLGRGLPDARAEDERAGAEDVALLMAEVETAGGVESVGAPFLTHILGRARGACAGDERMYSYVLSITRTLLARIVRASLRADAAERDAADDVKAAGVGARSAAHRLLTMTEAEMRGLGAGLDGTMGEISRSKACALQEAKVMEGFAAMLDGVAEMFDVVSVDSSSTLRAS